VSKKKIEKIHKQLHDKFGENLEQSLTKNLTKLDEAEIKSRAIFYLGKMLFEDESLSVTQKEVAKIFNEIFTDLTLASYLSCCAIDNSARIILRRSLELGLATVYLWDLPYKYWNWKNHDAHENDLSFREMIDYLNNKGHIDFVNNQNGTQIEFLIDKERVNKVYRELSNVVHGKAVTFESIEDNSFSFEQDDLNEIINLKITIQNILLSLWKFRFPTHLKKVEESFTPITKFTYE
jgi:hypothetical protein